MRNFKFLSAIGLVLVLTALFAFTSPPDEYRYGTRASVTLTCADTVDVLPNNLTLTYAQMDMDTNVVVNVDADNSIIGDRIVFEFTADNTDRTVAWNDNITASSGTVTADTIKLFEFIYNGTAFLQIE